MNSRAHRHNHDSIVLPEYMMYYMPHGYTTLPQHILRRISAIIHDGRTRPKDRFELEDIAEFIARRRPRRNHPLAVARKRAIAKTCRLDEDRTDAGKVTLVDWLSFRAFARRDLGCNNVLHTWSVWTSPLPWREKCRRLSEHAGS